MEITLKSEYGIEVKVTLPKDADLSDIIPALRAILIGAGYSDQSVCKYLKQPEY